jgi:RimJ/RimL family protein N-acetyltransferase
VLAPPIVETARLVLTPPAVADADAIFARYASDADVARYLSWPRHTTLADTHRFLAFSAAVWERDGVGPYLIWSKADGRLLGSTGLDAESGRQASTGYVLARDAWGHGYATEALTAMVEVAADTGFGRIHALCHPDNRASRHVLEKCRFERDSTWNRPLEFPNLAPGVPQAVLYYGRALEPAAP